MPDAFGTALRDFHLGSLDEPLIQRDGEETLEHPIEEFYFDSFEPDSEEGVWIADHVDGPLVDLGAGVGRDTLYFQEAFEVVAVEVSEALVETMEERGVEDARLGDMFALRSQFDEGRFQSVLSIGTQTCLAGSMTGLGEFLEDLAYVTCPTGTAIVDGYDPADEAAQELLGYRSDPAAGLAHRVMTFEYEEQVDSILYFRLFSPDRMREAASATPWSITDLRKRDESAYYRVVLTKA